MRVLLVEDSKRLQTTVGAALRRSGFAVDLAGDGEEGLWQATSNDYDVIVLDIMLPRLDGVTLLQRLRQQGNPTHVLLLTAKDTVEDRVRGLQAGADDYLVKPFALEELLARVTGVTFLSLGPGVISAGLVFPLLLCGGDPESSRSNLEVERRAARHVLAGDPSDYFHGDNDRWRALLQQQLQGIGNRAEMPDSLRRFPKAGLLATRWEIAAERGDPSASALHRMLLAETSQAILTDSAADWSFWAGRKLR